MRKYTRKKIEYNIIEGVLQLCRLCLVKTEEFVPIFTDDNQDSLCVSLALRIMMCTGLEVIRDENLPNKVCSECCEKLEQFYAFKKKCMFTYQKLKSHLSAIKPLNKQNANEKENLKDLTLLNKNVNTQENQLEILSNKLEKSKELKDSDILTSDIVKLEKPNQNCSKVQELQEQQNEVGVVEDQLVLIFNNNQQVVLVNKDVNNLTNYGDVIDEKKTENSLPAVNNTCNQIEEVHQSNEIKGPKKLEFSDTQTSLPNCTSILKPPEADLSSVLSAMLLELGIIVQDGDDVSVVDSRVIQLETADGDHVMIQLEEENEKPESLQPTIEEQKTVNEIQTIDDTQKNTCIPYNINKSGVDAGAGGGGGGGAVCAACGKALSSRGALWRHVREVHERARPHSCTACGRGFAQYAVLKRHELVHRESRPHKCGVCARSFTQAAALAAHERSHSAPGARALTLHCCQLCDKMFLYASGLSRHMLHHKGREYVCVRCGRQFGDRSSLLRHMRRAGHGATATATATADTITATAGDNT